MLQLRATRHALTRPVLHNHSQTGRYSRRDERLSCPWWSVIYRNGSPVRKQYRYIAKTVTRSRRPNNYLIATRLATRPELNPRPLEFWAHWTTNTCCFHDGFKGKGAGGGGRPSPVLTGCILKRVKMYTKVRYFCTKFQFFRGGVTPTSYFSAPPILNFWSATSCEKRL